MASGQFRFDFLFTHFYGKYNPILHIGPGKNNLAFSHPIFTISSIDPQSQNPQHNTAMPAVLLNQID
jgi:hypothetical protein